MLGRPNTSLDANTAKGGSCDNLDALLEACSPDGGNRRQAEAGAGSCKEMEVLDKAGHHGYLTFERFHPCPHSPDALLDETSSALERLLGKRWTPREYAP